MVPHPVIDTCNGFYCDYFSPNKPYKPTMWIEACTAWDTAFGAPVPAGQGHGICSHRIYSKGASFVNYYMYG